MTPQSGDRVLAMRSKGNWQPAVYFGPAPKDAPGLETLRSEDLSIVQFDGENTVSITYVRPVEAGPPDS